MSKRATIFATHPLPGGVLEQLAQDHQVELFPHSRAPTPDELKAGLQDAEILICLLRDQIDKDILKSAKQLHTIANYAVGTNNIDVDWATLCDIAVLNTPRVLTEATAELAFGLLLAVSRRLCEGDRMIRRGQWTGWEPQQLLGMGCAGKLLGIVGMGRIGQSMAKKARAFGMRIAYHNRHRLPAGIERELGAKPMELDALLEQSDVVSLHCPLTPDTHHLLNAQRLAKMKPDAILLNTSRGPVVDEAALVEALQRGHLRGAGLDVYEEEPAVHPGLLELEQVVLAPHLGSATEHTRRAMAQTLLQGIQAVLRNRRPANIVNAELFD